MNTENLISLPADAPIMVLPGCVLFPGTMLPLRIFEPRYRAMLAWALEHDRMFCVAMMKPHVAEADTVDEFHHVAGVGLIRASVTQSDGTSNLLLHGLGRVRFTDFVQLDPFRIAHLEPIQSIAANEAAIETLVADLRELCTRFYASTENGTEEFLANLATIEDPELLADFIASAVVQDPFQRQRLLEEPDVTVRLRSLTGHLRRQLDPS